jgi:hypothetical protein
MTSKSAPVKRRAPTKALRAAYRFDYGKSRPNRFAARMKDGAVAVVLDPDVASAFRTPASVNAALRSLLPNGASRRPRIL